MDEVNETRHTTQRVVRRPAARAGGNKKRLNWPYAILSVVIGSLLWVGVDIKRMKEVTLDLDIGYDSHLPADWKIINSPQSSVRVTLRGPNQEVSNLRKEAISVEPDYPKTVFDGDTYDGSVTLLPEFVRDLPPGVDAIAITPSIIPLRISRVITRYINVAAGEITGAPQEGYAVGKIHQIDPPAVAVSASRDFLSKITTTDVVYTKPFSVEGGKGLVGSTVGLEPIEKDGERVEIGGTVYMTVELEEIPAERQFEQPFEVRALLDTPFDRYGRLNLTPPSVKVTAAGPKAIIDKLSPGEIAIYADMRDRIPAAAGEFNIKCKAITPARVRVTRIEPDTVKWIAQPGN